MLAFVRSLEASTNPCLAVRHLGFVKALIFTVPLKSIQRMSRAPPQTDLVIIVAKYDLMLHSAMSFLEF